MRVVRPGRTPGQLMRGVCVRCGAVVEWSEQERGNIVACPTPQCGSVIAGARTGKAALPRGDSGLWAEAIKR